MLLFPIAVHLVVEGDQSLFVIYWSQNIPWSNSPKKEQLQCLQLPENNIYKKTSSLVDVIELQVEQMNEQSTKFFIDLRVYIYIEHRGTPWTGAMPVDGNRSCEQVPLRVGDEATSK